MQPAQPVRPFEWWWIPIAGVLGAGVGWLWPVLGIPLGAGLGMVAGLAVSLLRKSTEWRKEPAQRPHYHERRKDGARHH